MSRFGVMKHLGVLTEADLVVAVKEGRSKRLHLNPVPIEQVANRWISKYAARFTSALVAPPGARRRTRLMTITAHVYQIHIAADAPAVWDAITAVGVDPGATSTAPPTPRARPPARATAPSPATATTPSTGWSRR